MEFLIQKIKKKHFFIIELYYIVIYNITKENTMRQIYNYAQITTPKGREKNKYLLAICLFLGLSLSSFQVFAQEKNSGNAFVDYYYPSYNSDYFYYTLRHNYRLDHGLISLNASSTDEGTKLNEKTKLFVPLYDDENFNIVVPVYLYQTNIKAANSDVEFEKKTLHIFGQVIVNYFSGSKWDFTLIGEGHIRGDESSIGDKAGNDMALFPIIRYKLNEKFQFALQTLFRKSWNKDSTEIGYIPAGQIFFRASDRFRMMIGIPGLLGLEYQAPYRIDIVTNIMMSEPIHYMAAIRKRFTNWFDATFRFIREGDSRIYFESKTANIQNQLESFDNMSFVHNIYQLELGFMPIKETLIQIRGGYLHSMEVTLQDSDKEVTSLSGQDEYFVGVNITSKFNLSKNAKRQLPRFD